MLIDKIRMNFNKKASYKTKNYSYESISLDNVQGLANHILDKNTLTFNTPLVKIDRDDNTYLREMLAKMTPDERKKLGINKSTLWYIQKNLKDGKTIELYDKIKTKIR
jgi:CRISPR-associated protein Cas1